MINWSSFYLDVYKILQKGNFQVNGKCIPSKTFVKSYVLMKNLEAVENKLAIPFYSYFRKIRQQGRKFTLTAKCFKVSTTLAHQ